MILTLNTDPEDDSILAATSKVYSENGEDGPNNNYYALRFPKTTNFRMWLFNQQ